MPNPQCKQAMFSPPDAKNPFKHATHAASTSFPIMPWPGIHLQSARRVEPLALVFLLPGQKSLNPAHKTQFAFSPSIQRIRLNSHQSLNPAHKTQFAFSPSIQRIRLNSHQSLNPALLRMIHMIHFINKSKKSKNTLPTSDPLLSLKMSQSPDLGSASELKNESIPRRIRF